MSTDLNALEPLAERLLDAALIEAVRGSDAYLRHLLSLSGHPTEASDRVNLVSADRSVFHGENDAAGETDVMIVVRVEGAQVVLLVESKVTAGFQPRQGERYAARAAAQRTEGVGVYTVLVAPAGYLANGNPQVRQFDACIAVETLAVLAETESTVPLRSQTLLRALAQRAVDGRPLGAKGLFPELHGLLHDELVRRGSGVRITNRPTDWVFLRHPTLPAGSMLRYRIRSGLAELRFRGQSATTMQSLSLLAPPGLAPVHCGAELCFQRTVAVTCQALAGAPQSVDVELIATTLDELVSWFRAVVPPNRA